MRTSLVSDQFGCVIATHGASIIGGRDDTRSDIAGGRRSSPTDPR
jgi:hypothetical protein